MSHQIPTTKLPEAIEHPSVSRLTMLLALAAGLLPAGKPSLRQLYFAGLRLFAACAGRLGLTPAEVERDVQAVLARDPQRQLGAATFIVTHLDNGERARRALPTGSVTSLCWYGPYTAQSVAVAVLEMPAAHDWEINAVTVQPPDLAKATPQPLIVNGPMPKPDSTGKTYKQ